MLGIDIPLADQLPEDTRAQRFTTVADGQAMSHFQLQSHLAVDDLALDEAFRRALTRKDSYEKEFDARGLARTNPNRRCREPEMRNGQAVIWNGSVIFYGRIPATRAPEDGWYRFTLQVTALKPPENGGIWSTIRTGLWVNRPKPSVDVSKPIDIRDKNDFIGRQRLMSDMVRLALSTDSSRFITLHLGGSGGVLPIKGVEEGYHSLSHHGRDEKKLEQLALVETEILHAWGDLIRELHKTSDHGGTLLDHTAVLLSSNLGNASNHDNRNMPVLLAGGGFRHGQHLAFDRNNNYPLPNFYVSVMQQTGLLFDRFATSTGTMAALESCI